MKIFIRANEDFWNPDPTDIDDIINEISESQVAGCTKEDALDYIEDLVSRGVITERDFDELRHCIRSEWPGW